MDNYIKFWKHLPKFIYGLTFSTLIALTIFGLKPAIEALNRFDFFSINSLFQTVIFLLGIIIVSSAGIKFQDLLIKAFTQLLRRSPFANFIQRSLNRIKLGELLLTEGQIAKNLFIRYEKELVSYEFFKSWSQPEGLGQVKGLNLHYKKVSSHIKNIDNTEFIVNVNYFGSVTQEQASINSLYESVSEYFYLLLNIFLFFIFFLTNFYTPLTLLLSMFLVLLAHIIILPLIKESKVKLGYYIICGYLDNFTIGESATIIDREPSI